TQKEEGALAYDGKQLFKAGAYSTETVDRVGTGDAFDAGFVYGYLTGDINKALKYAVATAALKRTIPGDIALITLKEVEELVAKGEKTDIHR
ncbi:sugar kinase, partial [Candidatus Aerophobetes bacterium]|nr:sugar kinase [Candidatus Aerophobetes bacterium]